MELLVGLIMLAISGYLLYFGVNKHNTIRLTWNRTKEEFYFRLEEQPEGPKVMVSYIFGSFLFFVGLVLFLVGLFN